MESTAVVNLIAPNTNNVLITYACTIENFPDLVLNVDPRTSYLHNTMHIAGLPVKGELEITNV
ncbi:hypothetical protein HMPREF1168_02664 [Aeromonas veronii AMC34]|uniref:Uncharacterized protein n=1 Tax=Aeromonas veronii AMC34 TaxID=1073383 RepID=K1IIJ9_AERVE|nr:hypothetical protein HMPREF1168_02664 [Aeromonas veronii AMC34]